jgi:hypothetical protein
MRPGASIGSSLNCHIVYHLAAGMFTVLKYEGAPEKFWQPDKTKLELENPLELGSADALWKEMTNGLLTSVSDAP